MAYELDREICIIAVGMLLLAKIWQSGRCFNAFLKSQRQNKVFLTLGTLFLFLFIGRLVYAVDDFYLPYLVSPVEVVLWGKLGGLFDALGIGIFFLLLEVQQFHGKDKYIFFIGYLTFVILYLVTPDLVLAQIFMFIGQLFNLFLFYALISMIIKYKGEVRVRALKILLGWALFIISTVITYNVPLAALSAAFGVSIYVVNIVAFAIKIVGVSLLADGYL
jgi:hypothetical protein